MMCRSCTDSRPHAGKTEICAADHCTATTRVDRLICLACSTAAGRCERCLKNLDGVVGPSTMRMSAGRPVKATGGHWSRYRSALSFK